MTDAPIELVPYDAHWPAAFERERGLLEHALAPWLIGPPEHIGSTAVPGLAAKPVIDIMAPVRSLNVSVPAIDLGSRQTDSVSYSMAHQSTARRRSSGYARAAIQGLAGSTSTVAHVWVTRGLRIAWHGWRSGLMGSCPGQCNPISAHGDLLDDFSAQECASYFHPSGYVIA